MKGLFAVPKVLYKSLPLNSKQPQIKIMLVLYNTNLQNTNV